MKKLVLLIPALLIGLPGCLYVRDTRYVPRPAPARKDCHPSQYWDGEKCRHKGKGHGARKHDDDD
ncbi:hypothetical protein [Vitiosangium sp. GDMCC 1.1324]|uniref:hypothetical protein n=1 Tax=Vitiosangium sp. (strain GDMCC 1.1324) TaxID=2138576 RepID=UPI000D37A335|nr:hypothetical protein [Vitiosangium sp. GDMCC 1.1324]PTL84131.1 hypothetical protein DAT35_11865 [Vitiosangium sp. GDMCC 1.1324]